MFAYSGSYQVDDDRITATLTTRRYASGPPTVFGIDEVDVKITGGFNGMMASCSGTAEQAPGVVFEATLFLGQDQTPESDRKRAAVKFDAGKLPKGADSRYHATKPLCAWTIQDLILISALAALSKLRRRAHRH
jgi:hypothetical protein